MQYWASLLKSVDQEIVGDVEFVQGKWETMGNAMVVKQGKHLILLSERYYKVIEEPMNLPIGSARTDKENESCVLEKHLLDGLEFDPSFIILMEPYLLD